MTRFLGGMLVAIGVLVAGTTGLCTGAVIVMALPDMLRDPGSMLSASPLLLIGIVPCILGVVCARAGLKVMRSADQD